MKSNTIKNLLLIFTGVAGSSFPAIGVTNTVREDRVWVYSGLHEERPVLYYGEFRSGLSVNGKTYHNFVITKSRIYSVDAANGCLSGDYQENDMNLTLYSLREENGRIYELTADGKLAQDIDEPANDVTYEEIEIYDWNLADNESWPSNPFSQPWKDIWGIEANAPKIALCGNQKIAGTECKAFTLTDVHDAFSQEMTFIEGIGPTCCGTIGDMDPQLISGHFATTPYNRLNLKCVLNRDGEPIFGTDSASVITTDSPDYGITSKKTFDLFGHEVKSVLPGSIYIRDGKKYIAH